LKLLQFEKFQLKPWFLKFFKKGKAQNPFCFW